MLEDGADLLVIDFSEPLNKLFDRSVVDQVLMKRR